MIDLYPLRSKDYARNAERCKGIPCVICGRHAPRTPYYVHLHRGGATVVTEAEAATLGEAGDMGAYPIGVDCLAKHPEIGPYVAR